MTTVIGICLVEEDRDQNGYRKTSHLSGGQQVLFVAEPIAFVRGVTFTSAYPVFQSGLET